MSSNLSKPPLKETTQALIRHSPLWEVDTSSNLSNLL